MNSAGNVIKRIGLTDRPLHVTLPSMTLRFVCSCLAAIALSATLDRAAFPQGVPPPAAPSAPWFGTWQLVQAPPASRFDTPPYKKVTLRIEPWEDGLRVVYDMVRARGGITHVEWQGRFDGRDYPVQGIEYYLTNAYRPIDERSYEIIVKVDGRVAANAMASVSPDGGTLSVTTIERDARGRTIKTTATYRRQPTS
jgi:hypothetical protein